MKGVQKRKGERRLETRVYQSIVTRRPWHVFLVRDEVEKGSLSGGGAVVVIWRPLPFLPQAFSKPEVKSQGLSWLGLSAE